MEISREDGLRQAVVALIASAKKLGVDEQLINGANDLLDDEQSVYIIIDERRVDDARLEISLALHEVVSKGRS
ncbi:MAG: hypothetical protein ACRYF8_12335 [Janthinobacterium lividum]